MLQKLISYYFRHANFLRMFLWTSSEFFRFSSRKSQSQEKLAKKRSLIFQNGLTQITSLVLLTSTHLILEIIYSQNTIKNVPHFTNFPANMFLFGARKKIAMDHFLTPKNCILQAFRKQMSVFFSISL